MNKGGHLWRAWQERFRCSAPWCLGHLPAAWLRNDARGGRAQPRVLCPVPSPAPAHVSSCPASHTTSPLPCMGSLYRPGHPATHALWPPPHGRDQVAVAPCTMWSQCQWPAEPGPGAPVQPVLGQGSRAGTAPASSPARSFSRQDGHGERQQSSAGSTSAPLPAPPQSAALQETKGNQQ